ncbi:sensor histidine kinase [Gordoniibacillus kamchatkensis]|uniref:sensor histidine kinase n=1 Tax=Gordoniibacillus kamchatkensis TaxID=1590651 RepID=UPI0006967538|nr:sensor histidine kinase [Paenibacillus sp. VKM B-2647]
MAPRDFRSFGRPLAGAVTLFFIMNVLKLFIGPPPRIGLHLLIWATCSGILFFPKPWWTRLRVFVTLCILTAECAAALVLYQEIKLVYFVAICLLGTAIRLSLSRTPIPAIVAMSVTAILYIQFGRNDLISILSFLLLTVVLFLNIRNRMQRNEMYELNKQHLAELQEAYDQLQDASVTAMQHAVLEERTRIAREIHDSVGHSLTSLIVQMQAMRYMIKNDPAQAEQSLEGMLAVARRGLQDIRTSVHSLADDRSGSGLAPLKALLSRMEASASIRYTFHANINDEDLDVDMNGMVFRVLQEAVTNIIRHSRATQVDVSLTRQPGHIVMRIRDNGILRSAGGISEGFGLKTMKTRLEERGGRLRYTVPEPHGFELVAEIPAADPASRQHSETEG